MMKGLHSRWSACAMALVLVTIVQPVLGTALSCVVTDPVGDAALGAPPYQDIVKSQIKLVDSEFVLMTEVAGSVPEVPSLPPPGVTQIWWVWAFNLDRTAFPAGYPFAPGVALPADFVAAIIFDGVGFKGVAIDRRPLLTGGQAIVTTIQFSISGAELQVFVDANLIGNPSSFGWGTRTFDWSGPLGSEGAHVVDFGGPPFTPWPC